MFPFKVRRLTERLEERVAAKVKQKHLKEYLLFQISGTFLKVSMLLGVIAVMGYIFFAHILNYFYGVSLGSYPKEIEMFVTAIVILVFFMLVSSSTHEHFYKILQDAVDDAAQETD